MIAELRTKRLLLRPLTDHDADGIFALDSEKEVLRHLPEQPLTTIAEARKKVRYIQEQYSTNNTGRCAVVRLSDGQFLGWCGIKKVNDAVTNGRSDYYDIGYRFLPAFWGKGYAYEAARACLDYAFKTMQLQEIHATVMAGNVASARIAEKLGMHLADSFMEEGQQWFWYTIVNTLPEQ